VKVKKNKTFQRVNAAIVELLEWRLAACDRDTMINTDDHAFIRYDRIRSIKADVLVNCARIGFKP
jgi:hypothetical protein